MPTLQELTEEYDALRDRKEREYTQLEELKPKLTVLNHIKYNFDVLERDSLPDSRVAQRDRHKTR